MITKIKYFLFIIILSNTAFAQKDTVKLKEIEITSNRITLPFSKTSRTIELISSEEIQKLPANNVADLLQQIAGVDIRRRGVDGMQSDLYIRGGSLDQTLVLIDGVKMDDAQTGHHTMNAILDLNTIERIEVIKGPAARIYGQNAFTGAINIVTKKITENSLKALLAYGSYENKKGTILFNQKFKNGGILASVGYQESDGYRYNTDFVNKSIFLKANLGNYNITSSFTGRDFGANGFYASPEAIDQYEETQTSLVALGTKYTSGDFVIKPRVYWRRNQDMYVYIRSNPSIYRNLHISNKVGVETNVEVNSSFGKTGIGIDIARIFLVSNNLNDHNRTAITGFFEHRFELNKFDITPGVAISSYSDFDTNAFPGIDVGFKMSESIKLYGNIGYTYRVPTFTDLYYIGSTTEGNPELEAESALSEELGFKFSKNNWKINVALFHRKSDNLIDWTKENLEDKWKSQNFSEVITRGFETNLGYSFVLGTQKQKVNMSYSFIDDEIKDENVQFTRYSLNSIKHQFNTTLDFKFCDNISNSISYRYVERTDGESYNVVDAKISTNLNKKWLLSATANNIFNSEYSETNLVPMPKGNLMFGLSYKLY
ncbi:TonB-dependent receptor [Lutibacter sp. TH_r2]|uniref:TonB-dependent receptor n=1 Tax=Lutibacter sp. TH_r2 TaxID=3082083 RepID=UPI0029539957|nr:TonB-dependent receptor [Lutibacter sp. TH_r2]MDV7187237.1 TonB-dependent receptor [Lutibacter sp. TH_r2]